MELPSGKGEIRAVGQAAGDALGRNVTMVRGVHRAVADRVFGVLGPIGMPVRRVHDPIAGGVYGLVGGAHRLVPQALATGVALTIGETTSPISSTRRGSTALGALNGIRGDALSSTGNELTFQMTLRRGEREVSPEAMDLAVAYPDATPRLAIFVHGLCQTEWSWFREAETDEPQANYGERLQIELGYTPLYVRYNSGLHVSDNGGSLADLLTQVVADWPCPVEEIILIAHSMGGLVVRSACHQAAVDEREWVSRVRHVFCLGTPHLGSHVEQGANVVGWVLDRLPETRPFANAMNSRSAGIKDMRFGSCLESDWVGHDPDEFLKNRCEEVPFLVEANYYFIGATVTRNAHHPVGRLFGDLFVRFASASGQGRRRVTPIEIDNGRHLGGLHHFHLLNHPTIYEQMRRWLDSPGAERRAVS